MLPEKQRVALAEFAGWTFKNKDRPESKHWRAWYDAAGEQQTRWFSRECSKESTTGELPDYLNDLNAMAVIEKMLSPQQQMDYYGHKLPTVVGYGMFSLTHQNTRTTVSATAPQRAEALLRTIGKWDE